MLNFSVANLSMANCGWMVRDSTLVTMASLWETITTLSNGMIADPLRPLLQSKCRSQMWPSWYVEFLVAKSLQQVIWSTPCLVLG